MRVSPWQIIVRGLTIRCPNCGGWTLLKHWLKLHDRCPRCGLLFERESGFFLGAIVINYTVTTVLLIAPIAVAVFMELVSVPLALLLAALWCVLFPIAFFPFSKSLWLMTYYVFFPRDLPANGGAVGSRSASGGAVGEDGSADHAEIDADGRR